MQNCPRGLSQTAVSPMPKRSYKGSCSTEQLSGGCSAKHKATGTGILQMHEVSRPAPISRAWEHHH